MGDQQSNFFSYVKSPSTNLSDFAELCTALYEREILLLAQDNITNVSLLQRRMSGLIYHVRRVAHYMCQSDTPMTVDVHNASWQCKQSASTPKTLADSKKTGDWYQKHADLGLVVPVKIQTFNQSLIELDSVDRVHMEENRLHCNKHGWFELNGLYDGEIEDKQEKTLLKPSKSIMQTACCGHTWRNNTRSLPRALSLREIVLSTQIDWKHFRLKPLNG